MSSSRGPIRPIITIICVALTALGLRNTYADNSEEQRMAEQLACTDAGCSTNLVTLNRNPIAQTFVLQLIEKKGNRSQNAGLVNVECSREYVFLGDYRCEKKN